MEQRRLNEGLPIFRDDKPFTVFANKGAVILDNQMLSNAHSMPHDWRILNKPFPFTVSLPTWVNCPQTSQGSRGSQISRAAEYLAVPTKPLNQVGRPVRLEPLGTSTHRVCVSM